MSTPVMIEAQGLCKQYGSFLAVHDVTFSIPRGQVAAGRALGFNESQVMRTVVLPQAFRNMLPVLLTQTIVLFQDTSLVYVVSLTDFLGAASKIAQRDGKIVEMYVCAAAGYFIVSLLASSFVKGLQARTAIIR